MYAKIRRRWWRFAIIDNARGQYVVWTDCYFWNRIWRKLYWRDDYETHCKVYARFGF